MYVELLVFLIAATVIWTLMSFTYQAKKTAVQTQNRARECAWQFSRNNCQGGVDAACQRLVASPVDDNALRIDTDGSTTRLQALLPALPGLTAMAGDQLSVLSRRAVARPGLLGGITNATSEFRSLCGDSSPRWTEDQVFQMICVRYGPASWCQL